MIKSAWIVALSLLSMAHCASIGNGIGQSNGVSVSSAPIVNAGLSPLNPGAQTVSNVNSRSFTLAGGLRPLNLVTPTVTNVNSRSLSLGGGLHPVHNSPTIVDLNGGFDIGNGYLGYSNYHRSQPVVYQGKALPVTTTYIKPEPVEEDWSITPSLSYGYSYKLVPTHAYAPAHPQKPLFNFSSLNHSINHSINNLINQLASSVRRAIPNSNHQYKVQHVIPQHGPQPQALVQQAPVLVQ